MKPVFFEVIGNQLVVVWDDGHESYFPLEDLRRACPCAGCSGEPDLFGRINVPEPSFGPRSFDLLGVDQIGNYALQPNWADGHAWGIWTYDRLREHCGCDECRRMRSEE